MERIDKLLWFSHPPQKKNSELDPPSRAAVRRLIVASRLPKLDHTFLFLFTPSRVTVANIIVITYKLLLIWPRTPQ